MACKLVTRSKINGRKIAAVFVGIYRCNSNLFTKLANNDMHINKHNVIFGY